MTKTGPGGITLLHVIDRVTAERRLCCQLVDNRNNPLAHWEMTRAEATQFVKDLDTSISKIWIGAIKEQSLSEDLLIERAKNEILRRALTLSSQSVADLEDRLEVECFGADTNRSIVIAQAAASVGLANKGDSAFGLDELSLEQARALFRAIEKAEG